MKNKDLFDRRITDFIGRIKYSGDIGIEIECEGTGWPNIPISSVYKTWRSTLENSLRNGHEFVLFEPVPRKDVKQVLAQFTEYTLGVKFTPSLRTSVHIHVNLQSLTGLQFLNFLASWWIVESLLVGLNSPIREGNLFCLRQEDADGLMWNIISQIRDGSFPVFGQEQAKYGAINLAAPQKYRSIEFRFIKGTSNARVIEFWATGLFDLVMNAAKGNLIEDILQTDFSNTLPIIKRILPESFYRAVLNKYSVAEINEKVKKNWKYVYLLHNALEEDYFKKPTILLKSEDDEENPPQSGYLKPRKKSAQIFTDVDIDDMPGPFHPDPSFNDEPE